MACSLTDCINKDKCDTCTRQIKLIDHYMTYIPTCPHGYLDCVCDPAYIYKHHREWYRDMHGDAAPQDVKCECRNGDCYDDEDK